MHTNTLLRLESVRITEGPDKWGSDNRGCTVTVSCVMISMTCHTCTDDLIQGSGCIKVMIMEDEISYGVPKRLQEVFNVSIIL